MYRITDRFTFELGCMSQGTMRLLLQWPKGRSLFVKVIRSDTPRTLLETVCDKTKCGVDSMLLHKGRRLNPSLTFAYQNVRNGDSLIVYEQENISRNAKDDTITSFDSKIYSIMREAQIVHDRSFSNFEMNRKASLVYEKLYQSEDFQDGSDDLPSDAFETRIPEKRETVCDDPLPTLPSDDGGDCSSDEIYDADSCVISAFDTIEEAGKFFAKHPFSEWGW